MMHPQGSSQFFRNSMRITGGLDAMSLPLAAYPPSELVPLTAQFLTNLYAITSHFGQPDWIGREQFVRATLCLLILIQMGLAIYFIVADTNCTDLTNMVCKAALIVGSLKAGMLLVPWAGSEAIKRPNTMEWRAYRRVPAVIGTVDHFGLLDDPFEAIIEPLHVVHVPTGAAPLQPTFGFAGALVPSGPPREGMPSRLFTPVRPAMLGDPVMHHSNVNPNLM